MSENQLKYTAPDLKPNPSSSVKLKIETVVPDIRNGLLLSASNFELHKRFREAIFNERYIVNLRALLKGISSGIDHVQTEHGECYRINLYGDGFVLDYGNQIKLHHGGDDEVKVAVMLAIEKGWKGIRLTGSDDFKQAAFLEAVISGHFNPEQISGYSPTKEDMKKICIARQDLARIFDKSIIRSFSVEESDSGESGEQKQRHIPRLKI